ncbi:MAG: ABC transporter permease [Xenococcaceae cyanobacterium]
MDFLTSCQTAVSTLLNNKLRSSLTMLGIIIGNASVVALIGIGDGAQKLATEQFNRLGPNNLFVVAGSKQARRNAFDIPKTLVLQDAEAIAKQVPTVSNVAPEINRRELITYWNKDTSTMVIGTTSESQTVRRLTLARGRFLNDTDIQRSNKVVVLGSEVADNLFDNQNVLGEKLRIKNLSFKIIGIMKKKGSFFGTNQDDAVFIPISVMSSQIIGKTSPYGVELSLINIAAKDENSVDAAKFQIENLLRMRHQIINEDDFTVETPTQVLEIFNTVSTGLKLMLAAIASISLIVGGIGVMNIMLVSVIERTQEIGLRKAVGAKNIDILTQFLIEAIILSITGGIVGILIGGGCLTVIDIFSPLSPSISAFSVLISLSFSGSIGLIFGVIPAQKAAKLDPIVALRSS